MRFLFVSTIYPTTAGQTWMANELAASLKRRGHIVDVVHVDWRAPSGGGTETLEADGVPVIRVAPAAIRGLGNLVFQASKMLLTPTHVQSELAGRIDFSRYDALVTFTPASPIASTLAAARVIPTRILFVFDFYPICQHELGLIPGGPLYHFALARESRLYRSFTTLICNLPANIRYLRRHYRVPAETTILSHPLWSDVSPLEIPDRGPVRAAHHLPAERPIAIFGGQIHDGRGVEFMLEAARYAQAAGSPLLFLFVGEGRLTDLVDLRAAENGNVRRLGKMSREAYLGVASACDVGMVATVPGVTSFNFPTKTIDYLRAGLPVVAAVEPGSDFLDILIEGQVGNGVDFTDPEGFFRAIERLATDPQVKASILTKARKILDEVFDVELAADKVLASIEPIKEGGA